MAITPRHTAPPRTRRSGRRGLAAMLLATGLLLSGAACGFDVQTNRPYTPAQGVNDNIGDPPVLSRNLMVLSRENGVGFLSATLTATDRDALIAVAGKPIKADYAEGSPFRVTQPDPVGLGSGAVVVLTDRPLILLESPDLVVGLEAEITLTFSNAGDLKRRVPVVDADEQPYATISPTPTPATSP